MSSISFRYATLNDVATLAELAAKTFFDTYCEIDDPQELREYIQENFNPSAVEKLITNPDAITILAEVDSALAGYAIISEEVAPECVSDTRNIKLDRFYLDKDFKGKGVGAQFMSAIHHQARQSGANMIWLGVYEQNIRAIKFYEKSGFQRVGGQEFVFAGRTYVDPVYAITVKSPEDWNCITIHAYTEEVNTVTATPTTQALAMEVPTRKASQCQLKPRSRSFWAKAMTAHAPRKSQHVFNRRIGRISTSRAHRQPAYLGRMILPHQKVCTHTMSTFISSSRGIIHPPMRQQ